MKKTTTESDKQEALNLKYRHVNTLNKFFLCLFFSFLLLITASVTHAETQGSQFAYITNYDSDNVSIIDTSTNNVTDSVSVGSGPAGVAVNLAGTRAYVANRDSDSVSVIDTTTNTVTATVPVESYPYGVAVNLDGTRVYVANMFSDSVSVIDTTTNTVTATVPVGFTPIGVAVNPDGTKVYVASQNSNSIYVIDTSTNTVTATVPVGNLPTGVSVNPAGTKVYVTDYNDNCVYVINTTTNAVTASVTVGSKPQGVSVNPTGTKAYVANQGNDSVSVIDTSTNTVIASVPVGSYPYGVTVNMDGTKVYVANQGSASVSVIDTTTNTVTATVSAGLGPIAFGQFMIPYLASEPVLPVANFSSNVTSGYAPLSVEFTDSSENATGWIWDFGDGNSSTEQNITHTYHVAGNYTVNLTVSNVNGTDSIESTITVTDEPVLPVANFSSNVTSGYAPLSVEFTDSSENADERIWDFGDGSNSTDLNPVHVFSTAGNFTVNLTVSNLNGTDSIEFIITVTDEPILPVAHFSSNVTEGYVPLTVEFTDSSENATSWFWDFGDGNNSTERNPVHVFSTVGNYTVNLTAINGNGTDSKTGDITVLEEDLILPVANFGSNVTSGYVPLSVQFTDSSEYATGWTWFFGDENYTQAWTEVNSSAGWSVRSDHSAVSLSDGSIVVMGGNDNDGNLNDTWRSTDGGATWIEMNSSAGWSARYGHSAVSLSDGSIVIMGGADNGGNLNDVWRSTDGGATWTEVTSSAGWSARYYPISVSLSDGSIVVMGGSDIDGDFNDIWRSTDGGATWTEVNSSAGWSGRLCPAAVSLPDGSIVVMGGTDGFTYFNDVWRSTDGGATWSEMNSSAGWSGRYSHSAVSLSDGSIFVMGGNDGTTNLNDTWRSTDGGATWGEVNSSAGWFARYSHSAVSLSDGSIVVLGGYNDTNLNDVWRFQLAGSMLQNPTHTYITAGNYTVNLTAINGNGTNSTESIITVTEAPVLPVANFSSNVTSGFVPLSVQFNDSSENADEWNWDLGDGSNSTEQSPIHVFSSVGNFTINLTVSNVNGTDSIESTISVTESPVLPVANFTSNVSSGSVPLTVEFTDISENATSWIWDFGDGSNSTDQNPVHIYSDAGNYTVNLTAINGNGTDLKSANITVLDAGGTGDILPVANFSSNVSSGYAPLTVQFNDSSENATSLEWDFENDGTVDSTAANPVHTYTTAGNYTVNLTVINANGTDSTESTITITDEPVLPVANFTSNVTSGFVPLSVQFTDSSENATAWNWDFGDGNSSTDQNPLHVFPTAGNYTVNLTASNLNGTDSKTANITVSDYIYAYCIEKTVLDVSGNGSSANITKAGDIVRYEVCVENKGTLNLTNISVNDSLINLTGPVETLNSNDILEVGEHWHYTGNYTVTQEDLNNNGGGDGFINNTATVDCTELDAESDSVLVPIEQNPSCSIKKFVLDISGNGPQGNISSAGDVIEFRVNMTNNGNIDLSNISVRDSLLNLSGPYGDIGLFGLYQSSPVQYPGGVDGILSVGETWYYLGNYTVTQEDLNNNGGGDGFLNSTVTLESSETGPINESTIQYIDESSNESGSVSPGIHIEHNPGCSFSKSVIEVINGDNGAVDDAGDVIRYSILVTNEGNVELTGVTVSDPMITLTGPVESLSTDGVLELGENWTYTGNYTVTEDDMDNEGGGDEDIDNTATLSCNELSNKTSSVEVELIIPESSGGSSHSSGGSGGSPEPSTNIEVKEISQAFVTNGKAVQFDFTKNATCVVYVGFDSKKTAGKITTIAEQLKKKSTLTGNLTEGKVYKYFNVWVGNSGFVSSDNVENMAICFKVSKSWLQNENIGQDSITLNRYNNKIWTQLPVSLLKEDSKYLYFTADVPGYSFFAITGKSNASGGSVTEIKPDEPEYVEENTGNNNVKPETTDEENTGESGSKFGILSLIAFLLIACLAVVFLYFKGQEGQK
jgi:PGF-pre-PGF domain-containing protein/uncharacterized repeat protein (TIGR01451 family)